MVAVFMVAVLLRCMMGPYGVDFGYCNWTSIDHLTQIKTGAEAPVS